MAFSTKQRLTSADPTSQMKLTEEIFNCIDDRKLRLILRMPYELQINRGPMPIPTK